MIIKNLKILLTFIQANEPINPGAYTVGFANFHVKTDKWSTGEFHSAIYDMKIHPKFDPETKAHNLCIFQFYPLSEQSAAPESIGRISLNNNFDENLPLSLEKNMQGGSISPKTYDFS